MFTQPIMYTLLNPSASFIHKTVQHWLTKVLGTDIFSRCFDSSTDESLCACAVQFLYLRVRVAIDLYIASRLWHGASSSSPCSAISQFATRQTATAAFITLRCTCCSFMSLFLAPGERESQISRLTVGTITSGNSQVDCWLELLFWAIRIHRGFEPTIHQVRQPRSLRVWAYKLFFSAFSLLVLHKIAAVWRRIVRFFSPICKVFLPGHPGPHPRVELTHHPRYWSQRWQRSS